MTDEGESIYRETAERFWMLELVAEVRNDGLYVRLAPLQRSFRHVPATEIASVDVTTYSAASYSGWHWGYRRALGGNTVYRLRGDRGVELTLEDGETLFVGSQSPAELEAAIQQVMESA